MKRFLAPLAFVFAAAVSLTSAHHADGQVFKKKTVTVTSSKTETLPQPAPAAAAQVEASAKKTGPIFNVAVRMKLREELRKKGKGPLEIARLMKHIDDEVINSVMADAETLSGVKVVGTAIGDGKIIGAIIDFFKSPQGQALLDALIKLLLGLLLVHDNPAGTWHSSLQSWNA